MSSTQPCGESGNGIEWGQWEGDEDAARLHRFGADEAIRYGELGAELCAGEAEAAIGEQKGEDLAMARAGGAGEAAQVAPSSGAQPGPAAAEDDLTAIEDGVEIGVPDEEGVGERPG